MNHYVPIITRGIFMKKVVFSFFALLACISTSSPMKVTQKVATKPFKEIEIKFKLVENTVSTLKEWLKKNADFKREEQHKEVYLDNPEKTFFFINKKNQRDACNFLRVRTATSSAGSKSSVCYKYWHKDENGIGTHCDEYETSVGSAEMMLPILQKSGYTEMTFINKKREIYMSGIFEIVIDDVETLGTFVEIELKVPTENVNEGREHIEDLMKNKIGIVDYKKINGGYPHLIWNPGKLDEYTY